jgi:hypothetical protein
MSDSERSKIDLMREISDRLKSVTKHQKAIEQDLELIRRRQANLYEEMGVGVDTAGDPAVEAAPAAAGTETGNG